MTGRWIFAQEGVGTNDEERTFRKLKSSGVNHGYEVGYLSGGEGMRMELGLVRVPERCLDTAWRAFHTEVKSTEHLDDNAGFQVKASDNPLATNPCLFMF